MSKAASSAAQAVGGKLALCPAECVVVEDASAGIQAAKAGGFYVVSIGDGTALLGPDRSISKLAELPVLCQKLRKAELLAD